MSKLIIDAAKDNVFFMIIDNDNIYNISYENSKKNYEKLTLLMSEFLKSKKFKLDKISHIYVNRGPGSFAGIRNSLSIVKAIHLVNKTDFIGEIAIKYENIPKLCETFKIKKNLINPIYLS